MCQNCIEYGDGGPWHLNPKNYARRMYADTRKPDTGPKEVPPEQATAIMQAEAFAARNDDPEKFPDIRDRLVDFIGKTHGGQVVTLQEAKKMLDLASPIALIGCVCRRWVRGKVEAQNEFSCMGLGVGMLKWDRWPERYKEGVRFVSADEGKEWLEKWNKAGMVQTLMIFNTPYIGGLCNCDYPTCLAIRYRMDYGYDTMLLKGHYVAQVDTEACNGCARCYGRCQFGALTKEVFANQAYIDATKCFGCGLCERECYRDAIKLVERESLPALADAW